MRLVPLVLAAALLALPAAVAQLPGVPQPCADITVDEPAVPSAVPAGGSTSVVVTVNNPNQVPVRATVTAVADAPGWTVSAPDPASIPAQGSADFTFTVTAGGNAVGDAVVTFSASGACESPQGVPCPGDACNAGSVNTQVQVPLEAEGGFTLPSFGGASPELLIAGVVLIGLASIIPFAMRRKKTGVVADCPEPLKIVRPGRGTSFPIEIRNPSKAAATAQFEVGPVPEGWSAFMPLPEVQLAARESRSLWLMVRSPQEAKVGETVDVELRLRDPRRGTDGAVVKVRAEVQAGAEP